MTSSNPSKTKFLWGVYYPERNEMERWETRALARTVARDMRKETGERVMVLSPKAAEQLMSGITDNEVNK